MNIWYFHHYATPTTIAGLHRPFEFGKYFLKNNSKLTVFSSSYLHYSGENIIRGKERYVTKEYDGIKTVYVKTSGYENSGVKRILNMYQFYKRLIKVVFDLLKKGIEKPDVIIASSPHPLTMLAGLKIAKKLKIPCVCEVRDFWPEVFFTGGKLKKSGLIGKYLLRKERQIYTKSDALVFLKEGDHMYIKENAWDTENGGPVDMNKCIYVNNGVDIKTFDNNLNNLTIEDSDLDNDKFKVVYCGTIRPVNNVEILVDVAKLLKDVQILIYGSGSCVKQIQERINNENVNNIKLKGYIENDKVPYVLNKSSVNILNYSGSKYNWSRGNSSNKLFEYLASGRPVISTVKMGYDILERYNCGVSTEECTPEQIAEKIMQIFSMSPSEYQAMSENARKAAMDFDIENLAQKYLTSLEKVVCEFKTEEK